MNWFAKCSDDACIVTLLQCVLVERCSNGDDWNSLYCWVYNRQLFLNFVYCLSCLVPVHNRHHDVSQNQFVPCLATHLRHVGFIHLRASLAILSNISIDPINLLHTEDQRVQVKGIVINQQNSLFTCTDLFNLSADYQVRSSTH